MERQIPGGVPWVLPLVGHRNDMLIDHVVPLAVAHVSARPHRIDAMFREPFLDVETEVLFAPQHSSERLAHDLGFITVDACGSDGSIKLVCLTPAGAHGFCKALEGVAHCCRSQVTEPQPNRCFLTCVDLQLVMAGNLGACMRRVHGILLSMNDVLVDSVFHIWTCIGSAEDPLVI